MSAPSLRVRVGRSWRRARRRVRAAVGRLTWRARSSMQLRVVGTALVVGVITVAALGAYLSSTMRDGLFDQRLEQINVESANSIQQAQSLFTASVSKTKDSEIQTLLLDVHNALRTSGSPDRKIFLMRPEGAPSRLNDVSTDNQLASLVSDELRDAVMESDGRELQSVAIPRDPSDPNSPVDPGVLVGSKVQVPTVGTYELYFLYTLAPEQETLSFLQRTLVVGAVFVVGILGLITWVVTRQAVQPVRNAAGVAERLADGHLNERLPVKGHDELATLARSFNEMAESLQLQIGRMEELSLLQRRFVSDVSHELRTPLTTIRMAGEVLHASRDDFDPASKRSAELLQTQLDRFEDLLADLLEISRFDAGAAQLDAERRDVRDVVNAAVELAAPLAERKGVWMSVHLPDEAVTADVDPRRVERIVRNLVVNAIEHAEEKPVEITVAHDRYAAAVVVRDHGVGMTQEEALHVFDRFWRADPARARTTGGTGLGLAISLEDAHLHGGWLEVWGRPGQGAAFRLTLPLRAGIRLESSPLPLVPEEPTRGRGFRPPTGQIERVEDPTEGTTSPSALPVLTDENLTFVRQGGVPERPGTSADQEQAR
ncbi:MtrAB system histidine kinase MtrB [Oerskovia jenensis]|uniref:MtrAB system histidine kinase MtrB n=1 Tax=Oerskovia jenensis TaxID=162169 RepID=UPI0036D8F253